jgi:2-iminobutanoate/2-iminopropanoate deaminase
LRAIFLGDIQMSEFFVEIKNAPAAVGPYSPIAKTGSLYFFSGQIPLNPETNKIVEGGIEAQTTQVLANIDALLTHINKARTSIVKTTIFLTDLKNFQTVNTIYADWMSGHKPARSTIQVSALPLGAEVEIECIVEA